MISKKILLVDDESTVLELYQLQLESDFDIDIAQGGEQALKLLDAGNTYAVVVSDMHMPEIDGSELLSIVQQRCPTTTRIMLTGDDQQEVAIKAVNEGQIFRFLNKPCTAETLATALHAGVEQHRLRGAEKELLEHTLRGSVNLLVDLLSVVKPLAFGRASRVKRLVEQLCDHAEIENSWELKLAAMLSQIGCVSLTDDVLTKLHETGSLTAVEQMEFNKHPVLGANLVSKIPRLEQISHLISVQLKPYEDLPRLLEDDTRVLHASILAVALAFDRLILSGATAQVAIAELKRVPKKFSRQVVSSLEELIAEQTQSRTITLAELRVGMVLEGDIKDDRGSMLVTQGQQISQVLLERLMRRSNSISQTIHVAEVKAMPTTLEVSGDSELPSRMQVGSA